MFGIPFDNYSEQHCLYGSASGGRIFNPETPPAKGSPADEIVKALIEIYNNSNSNQNDEGTDDDMDPMCEGG